MAAIYLRPCASIARVLVASTVILAATFATARAQATIDVGSPSNALTLTQSSATFPVTLTRASTTPLLGFSVVFTLSADLSLASGTSSIVLGPFLGASGASSTLQVRDLGGGQYAADGVTLGTPCGSSALSGTLFTVTVAGTAAGATGTVTLNSVSLRDCGNAPIASVLGSNGSVTLDHTAPVVAVTSPNGGESWLAGSSHAITWTATDPEGFGPAAVDLEWSANNGGSWSAVATGTGNSGSFTWSVPVTSTLAALVRVTARDVNNNSATDPSDAVFTIQDATATSLASAPNPSIYNSNITLTATVTPAAAAGSVEFFDGATSLGTAPLSSGTAAIVTSALSVGVHSLTATYLGSAAYAASSSASLSQEVLAEIVATAGAHGSITPSGSVLVSLGATPAFAFAADAGYHVASVTVDGGAVALTSPYTFAPVSANHTIDVQFVVNPPVPAIADLAATTQRTGNTGNGIERIRLDWSPVAAGSSVQVWRAAFGNAPEYDDPPSPGSVPAVPSDPPGAPWVLTSVTTPGGIDTPPARDFWYYVAVVTDGFGTRSPVSNRSNGALDYALGDVSDGLVAGQGDGLVNVTDISLLGSVYGRVLTPGDSYDYLDVGPTTDFSVNARPTTDNLVGFEDLLMFALNFNQVSGPAASATPVAAAHDELSIEVPAPVAGAATLSARLVMRGSGVVHGLSATLSWDASVVEPTGQETGAWLTQQNGVAFSPAPGSVDLAVLGSDVSGLSGEGELANVTFRVLRAGDPEIGFARVDARDGGNHRVALAHSAPRVGPSGGATRLGPASPTPFRDRTQLNYTLAESGTVELSILGVDGRQVRSLISSTQDAGEHRLVWDGRDDEGHSVAAGVYYARLRTPHERFSRKLMVIR